MINPTQAKSPEDLFKSVQSDVLRKSGLQMPTTGTNLNIHPTLPGTQNQASLPPAPQPVKSGFFKSLGGALIGSEKNLARDITSAFGKSQLTPEQAVTSGQNSQKLIDKAHSLPFGDPNRAKFLKMAASNDSLVNQSADEQIKSIPTNKQVVGDSAGVLMDVILAGSFNGAAKSFELGGKALKLAETTPQALSTAQRLVEIAKGTLKASAKGAGVGYGLDVARSLQDNENIGDVLTPGVSTAVGGAIPLVGGVYKASKEIGKSVAPRIINSLIKPLAKDLSYGKDPGRTVAELGITGNSMDDLAKNLGTAKKGVGRTIESLSDTLDSKAVGGEGLSLVDSMKPLDDAMEEAAKHNNKSLLSRLANVKQAVMEDLSLGFDDKTGDPIIKSAGKRNLENATFKDAFKIKRTIGDMTQFTGAASDDSTVNSALKQIYGKIKQNINDYAAVVDPAAAKKLLKANEQYGDLVSAEVATKYRDKIATRSDLTSLKGHLGAATAAISVLASGGASIPVVLAGLGGAALDKTLGSAAVKTRVAAWLAHAAPDVVVHFSQAYPNIASKIADVLSRDNAEPPLKGKGEIPNYRPQEPNKVFEHLKGEVLKMPISKIIQGDFKGYGQQLATNFKSLGKDPMNDALNFMGGGLAGTVENITAKEAKELFKDSVYAGLKKLDFPATMKNAVEHFTTKEGLMAKIEKGKATADDLRDGIELIKLLNKQKTP